MPLFNFALVGVRIHSTITQLLQNDLTFTVYSNSLLARLNARKGISRDVDNITFMMASIPTSNIADPGMSHPSIAIRIDTSKIAIKDEAFEMASTRQS